jgi:adenylate kinase
MNEKNDRAAWIKGGNTTCSNPPRTTPDRVWRLVLLGSPGVGKGTQAVLMHERLGACHLSTGDAFRAAKSLSDDERSPALNEALEYMRHGNLVPDKIVLDVIRERMNCLRCPSGFLLDGFPRTVAQAEALEKLLQKEKLALTAVLNYELPLDEILSRLGGRRTCSGCKAVFHVVNLPPRVEGICDFCGAKLFLREDDRPESIRVRMEVYEKSTKPLIDFYRKRGLLVTVVVGKVPEETYQRTMKALGIAAAV